MLKKILRVSLVDLQFIFRNVLLFEFVYMLLTSWLFLPAMSYLFNRMLRGMSAGLLLNQEVYQIGLSWNGLLWTALIGFCCTLLLFVEIGVILLVSHHHISGRRIYMLEACLLTIRSLPRLFGIGFVPIALLFFLMLPLTDSPLFEMLLGHFNWRIIVGSVLDGSRLLLVVYVVLALLGGYGLLRLIFVLHYVLLHHYPMRRAVRASIDLTRARAMPIVLQVVAFNVVMVLLALGWLKLTAELLALLQGGWVKELANRLFLPFASLFAMIQSLIAIPLNVIFMTRLFHRIQRRRGMVLPEPQEQPVAARWRELEERIRVYLRRRRKRFSLLLLAAVYAGGTLFLGFSFHDNLLYLKWHVQIAAHRGDMSQAPENTLRSVRDAYNQRVDVIEIDVQLSRDGVVVLNHDYSLQRVASELRSVHEMDFAEIAELPLRLAVEPEEGEEADRIPALIEVLEEVKGKAQLLIEIKPYGDKLALADAVAALVQAYDMVHEVRVQSFDYAVLERVRAAEPDIMLGQILFLSAGRLSQLDVDFYTIRQSMLTRPFIKRAHDDGREVWVWTVNHERNMREVLKYDIDGIITDNPSTLARLIGLQ